MNVLFVECPCCSAVFQVTKPIKAKDYTTYRTVKARREGQHLSSLSDIDANEDTPAED